MSRRSPAREDVIRVEDRYYILSSSSRIDDRKRVLKDGDTFAVFDRYGDIHRIGLGEQGLFHQGTRFLSRFELRVDGERPLLLSSTVRQDNALLAVDLANPDPGGSGEARFRANTFHVFRSIFLWNGRCFQRFRVDNFALAAARIAISIAFEADFTDIFEVRGISRPRRGELFPPRLSSDSAVLAYRGLDGVERRTRIEFSPAPARVSESEAVFEFELGPKSEANFCVTISCEAEGRELLAVTIGDAVAAWAAAREAADRRGADVYTSNEQFNDWLNRSRADLAMMVAETPEGPYPHAGVPWFSTVFGRDGIITALECLWLEPILARGVLAHLAARQAAELIPEKDAEPGKILHETRLGEMAALGEIPFGLYYGSIDSTPLFVMLAAAYYRRSGDRGFVASIWPNVERALAWIDGYGDGDGDGFVEYVQRAEKGLSNQGWKDSQDSVFHADGRLAEPPITLCEVQGYAYAARRAGAELAIDFGRPELAARLAQQAEKLRTQFEESFWVEDLSTYALALDRQKRPCRVRTSNAGHVLYTGLADPERARRAAVTLLAPDSFSGWGIRTLASSEARYNPMSYHNGSVWPHDNALVAAGLARYGLRDEALRVLRGLFDATIFLDLHRLPELFCGFGRRPGEGPTLYPVACAPQAWSVAAVFLLVQVALGIDVDGLRRRVRFSRAALPEYLEWVRLTGLAVGEGSLDVTLRRTASGAAVEVERQSGDIEVVVSD